jgi:hypothetical protein
MFSCISWPTGPIIVCLSCRDNHSVLYECFLLLMIFVFFARFYPDSCLLMASFQCILSGQHTFASSGSCIHFILLYALAMRVTLPEHKLTIRKVERPSTTRCTCSGSCKQSHVKHVKTNHLLLDPVENILPNPCLDIMMTPCELANNIPAANTPILNISTEYYLSAQTLLPCH